MTPVNTSYYDFLSVLRGNCDVHPGRKTLIFYRATLCQRGISCHRVSVRPSITSRSCTKTAKPSITLRTPYDSPGTLSFPMPKILAKFRRHHSQRGRQIEVGQVQIGGFRSAISQKRCKIGTQLLWKANKNLYALYRMTLFSMTLVTPNHPKPPHFQHFAAPIIFPYRNYM